MGHTINDVMKFRILYLIITASCWPLVVSTAIFKSSFKLSCSVTKNSSLCRVCYSLLKLFSYRLVTSINDFLEFLQTTTLVASPTTSIIACCFEHGKSVLCDGECKTHSFFYRNILGILRLNFLATLSVS